MPERRIVWRGPTGGLLVVGLLAGLPVSALHADDGIELSVLSSRPDAVSGGDALLGISVPSDVAPADVRVAVNRRDATAAFHPDAGTGGLVGRVDGLRPGANEVSVAVGNEAAASLTLVNHPAHGPVFSGPHEQPFVCETEAFELPSGETLGAPLDEHCSISRRIDYAYRAAGTETLRPLADPAALPADVAMTTTLDGTRVPYVVRIETGTANRAIYQIALLHAPGAGHPDVAPWAASPGWNGRLIYTFGGGCVNGWYRQGARTGGVTDDVMLRRGYAVASASLNVYGNNCNDVLAAETMMLVKERFIEATALRATRSAGAAPAARTRTTRLPTTIPACSTASFRAAASRTSASAPSRWSPTPGSSTGTSARRRPSPSRKSSSGRSPGF